MQMTASKRKVWKKANGYREMIYLTFGFIEDS